VIPEQAAPGQTVPVVYQLSGPWEGLRQGLLLLTWQPENGNPRQEWTHDHGIGFGRLASSPVVPIDQPFQVTERSGMILPENLAPGRYRLEATYVNRQSGLSQPLEIPAHDPNPLRPMRHCRMHLSPTWLVCYTTSARA
jgi:hypothetical protein